MLSLIGIIAGLGVVSLSYVIPTISYLWVMKGSEHKCKRIIFTIIISVIIIIGLGSSSLAVYDFIQDIYY